MGILGACDTATTPAHTSKKNASKPVQKPISAPVKPTPEVTPKDTLHFLPHLTNENLKKHLTAYGKAHPETILRLTCKYGTIDIKLYQNTPLHRANMVYLTNVKYFDETLFYRVSKNFVDQAGNSDQLECQDLRSKIGSYTLPAEFNKVNIHKTGAVAMARRYDKNPDKRSSPFEFYIVLGRKWNAKEMRATEREYNITYSADQKNHYMKVGGTPYLDRQHTVIGEVISGMDVAYEINKVNVDKSEWPLTDIPIKMEVIR